MNQKYKEKNNRYVRGVRHIKTCVALEALI